MKTVYLNQLIYQLSCIMTELILKLYVMVLSKIFTRSLNVIDNHNIEGSIIKGTIHAYFSIPFTDLIKRLQNKLINTPINIR